MSAIGLAAVAFVGVAPIVGIYVGATAGGIATCAAGLALWQGRKGETSDIAKYVNELQGCQPHQFAGDIEQFLPVVDDKSAHAQSLQQLRAFLVTLAEAFQSADQDKARAEVRHRRAIAQRDQLRGIIHGLSEPVLAINEYDELVVANKSAAELFHFADDFEKQAVSTLVDCQELLDLLHDSRRHRTANRRAAEVAVVNGDEKPRWFDATIESLAGDANGSEKPEHGAIAVLRDITDRKDIQRRHAEFVSSVSHEMKTPLASIKAYVELLADGDAEDEQTREEFLQVINGQADRLKRLIDNLLNIARIEAGVVHVEKQEQSLNDVLKEAAQVVQPTAEQKQITLTCELSPLYLGVFFDRDMILQSAINLLSNAVKYTPEKGSVTLRSRTDDECVLFEVEDTGVGLNEEDAARVFEKFYRVKKDANMAPGTGLGLPLAKHIVEDVHGGTLSVESGEGQGSTFRVALPNKKRS